MLLSARPRSTLSNSFFICSLEVGFLPFLGSSTLAILSVFSEVFCKCFNALFASVKAGSEIKENGLLSGSEREGNDDRVLVENDFDRDNVCHMAIKVFRSSFTTAMC